MTAMDEFPGERSEEDPTDDTGQSAAETDLGGVGVEATQVEEGSTFEPEEDPGGFE